MVLKYKHYGTTVPSYSKDGVVKNAIVVRTRTSFLGKRTNCLTYSGSLHFVLRQAPSWWRLCSHTRGALTGIILNFFTPNKWITNARGANDATTWRHGVYRFWFGIAKTAHEKLRSHGFFHGACMRNLTELEQQLGWRTLSPVPQVRTGHEKC